MRFTSSRARLFLSAFTLSILIARGGVAQSSEEEVTLAWFEGSRGTYRTYELHEGRVTRRRTGLFVAVENELIEIQIERVSTAAWTCDHETMVESRVPGRRVHGLRLIAARGTTSQVLLDSGEMEGNEHVADEIILHGSLGPFLSVERRTDDFPVCSAHPSTSRSFFWFDLRDGSQLDVDANGGIAVALPAETESQLTAAEQRLRAEFRQAIVDSGSAAEDWEHGAPFWVDGVVPRLEGDRWAARVYVALGVPYAWSEGPAAYQRVTEFDVPHLASWMPEQLTTIPSPIARFARNHRNLRFGGLSTMQVR